MIRRWPLLLAFLSAALSGQAIAPGEWTGTITVREVVAPGVPGFLLKMARGKSKSEKRCVSPALAASGVVALLAPDPKAKCSVASQTITNGRYDQVLMCPQKNGVPLKVVRGGTYSAAGTVGQVAMEAARPRGSSASTATSVSRGRRRCAGKSSLPGHLDERRVSL